LVSAGKQAWWSKGAEKDPEFKRLSFLEKWYSEIGNKALPNDIHAQYSHIADPVARGRAIAADYGFFFSTLRVYPAQVWRLMSTGPTAGGRMLGELPWGPVCRELPRAGTLGYYIWIMEPTVNSSENTR